MKNSELRDMSDEQLQCTLKETETNLLRLLMPAQTGRVDARSERKKQPRWTARIQTLQGDRRRKAAAAKA